MELSRDCASAASAVCFGIARAISRLIDLHMWLSPIAISCRLQLVRYDCTQYRTMLSSVLLVSLCAATALAAQGPCDIYDAAKTPCVAAHSVTRALYGQYAGRLYQITRASDNKTAEISALGAGGAANAATQDAFCGSSACAITRIYDQSPVRSICVEGCHTGVGQVTSTTLDHPYHPNTPLSSFLSPLTHPSTPARQPPRPRPSRRRRRPRGQGR